MLNLLKRNAPAAEAAPAEPDRVAELRARRRELMERIAAMKTATVLISPNGPDTAQLASHMREAAEPFLKMSHRKLAAERDKAERELVDVVDDLSDAKEDEHRAAVRVMKCKARELDPAHRAAVARIADALESLAVAMAEERQLREQVCLGAIAYLPSLGLREIGTPSDPNSIVSRWATDARRAGYLE